MRTIGFVAALAILVAGCSKSSQPAPQKQTSEQNTPAAKTPAIGLGPDSADNATAIAKRYVAEKHPDLDVSHRPPAAQYHRDNKSTLADGEPFWTVSFAVPAPRDKAGNIVGVRPFHTFGVYIDLSGNVISTMSHSP